MPRFRKASDRHSSAVGRPELVWIEAMSRRRIESASDEGGAQNRARQQHWRAVDVAAMIIAALQVVLPFVLVLVAAAAGVYGLFMLAFG